VLEVGMITFLRGRFGPHLSPIVFFVASLTIGLGGIRLAFLERKNKSSEPYKIPVRKRAMLVGYLTAGIGITSIALTSLFANYRIDVKYSDIIPIIAVMVKRLLNNEFPYQVISEWGYKAFPAYLPLQWMPFIISEVLHFDYRWTAFVVLCIALAFYGVYVLRRTASPVRIGCLWFLPFFTLLALTKYDPQAFGISIETLIAAYYLILSLTIFSQSNFLRGLGLLLCLLSRYSLILWVPLYLGIIFLSEKRKNAFVIAAVAVLGIILIYGVPFLVKKPSIFLRSHAGYTTAATVEWQVKEWQASTDKPYHLFRGIGFASFFYDYLNGALAKRLRILQIFHLAASVMVIGILGLLFLKFKEDIDYKIFALAGLKIYLAFFYDFIQIPYSYLFIVPVFVSIPVLAVALSDGS